MLRYYITDRDRIGGTDALLRNIERLGDSIDLLQVREKDLTARELARLVRVILRVTHPKVQVLVNDRTDIAAACGAHGVHLRGDGLDAGLVRGAAPNGFRISVACHSIADVRRAAAQGADYALLSPIFQTPGKGPSLGLAALREAAGVSAIPVLALGGVTAEQTAACVEAGAAGIAAISYFQGAS